MRCSDRYPPSAKTGARLDDTSAATRMVLEALGLGGVEWRGRVGLGSKVSGGGGWPGGGPAAGVTDITYLETDETPDSVAVFLESR